MPNNNRSVLENINSFRSPLRKSQNPNLYENSANASRTGTKLPFMSNVAKKSI